MKVPYYPLKRVNDSFGSEIQEAALQVIESGWFIRGKECENFEAKFSAYCGSKFCVGVGNGLEALSLILKGFVLLGRLQRGDGVIVPSNTFIATWLAVTAAGLVPVPAEPDENTSVLGLNSVEKALSLSQKKGLKVSAILAVHLYGRLCPMDELKKFADAHGLLLLEDAAQAHGACMNIAGEESPKRAGNLGDAAGFSFYPGKNLGALGDAGAVVTNNEALARMVRMLANYGSEQKYVHDYAGENSRLDEMQAAILSKKLPRLDEDNFKRNAIAKRYVSEIKNPYVALPDFDFEKRYDINGVNVNGCVWHIFPVYCRRPDGSSCRNELQEHLSKLGVETLIHYPTPPHLQKAFADEYGSASYPIAERMAREELSLPLHPFMTEDEISAVIDGVNRFTPVLKTEAKAEK